MRFEYSFLLAMACAALAKEDGSWTIERHQSSDCTDSGGGSVIGESHTKDVGCRDIYNPEEGDDHPAINSVLMAWNGDYKGFVSYNMDNGCIGANIQDAPNAIDIDEGDEDKDKVKEQRHKACVIPPHDFTSGHGGKKIVGFGFR